MLWINFSAGAKIALTVNFIHHFAIAGHALKINLKDSYGTDYQQYIQITPGQQNASHYFSSVFVQTLT